MNLQRVMTHLRKQEWTLIVIDFLIVVVGVFIGMQVQDWNNDRQARARAEVFQERLRRDVAYEHWNYTLLDHYYNEVLVNAGRTVDALTAEKPLSDEQLLISAYRASQYRDNFRRRATYDELVSTGTIGLIPDGALRDMAIAIFNDPVLDDTKTRTEQSDYRREFRRTVPAQVQHALLQRCGDRTVAAGDYAGSVGTLDYPCALGLAPERIALAAAALRNNSALLPALRQRFADLETARVDIRDNPAGAGLKP